MSEHYRYNGPEYEPDRDNERLDNQLMRVKTVMRDKSWRTLREISSITGDPESSISAQLRHLRKPKHGSHTVNRRSRKGNLFEYQLVLNYPPMQDVLF